MTTVEEMAWRLMLDRIDVKPNPYRADPCAWVEDRLDEFLWSKQREIMNAVVEHRRVAVKACHGPGKSFTAARLVCWYIDNHAAGRVLAVTSAPTDKQVKAVLWHEIRQAHGGRLSGDILQNGEWKIGPDLVALGRKPADHDEHGFQGLHRPEGVLVVLDEACGIPMNLWTAAGTLGTSDDSRFLAIGNPDDPTSRFAEVCDGAPDDGTSGLSREGWWVITISLFDTPQFTGEQVPADVLGLMPGEVWLEEKRVEYGEDSPLWLSKVLGQFPQESSSGVIPWSWVVRCRGEEATGRIGPLRVPIELGVDVAGSDAGDETVIFERCGARVGRMWRVRSSMPDEVVDLVERALRESGAESVKYDAIGIGHMLPVALRSKFRQVAFVPVHVGEAASDPSRFKNLKAEIWWEVGRQLSKDGGWDLTEADEATVSELASVRWWEDAAGRIQIESKGEVRKRIGRSTDRADALLLAFYAPPPVGFEPTSSMYRDRRLSGRR